MFHAGKDHLTHHLQRSKQGNDLMTDDFMFQITVNSSTFLFAKGKGNFPEFHLNKSHLKSFRKKKENLINHRFPLTVWESTPEAPSLCMWSGWKGS